MQSCKKTQLNQALSISARVHNKGESIELWKCLMNCIWQHSCMWCMKCMPYCKLQAHDSMHVHWYKVLWRSFIIMNSWYQPAPNVRTFNVLSSAALIIFQLSACKCLKQEHNMHSNTQRNCLGPNTHLAPHSTCLMTPVCPSERIQSMERIHYSRKDSRRSL